MAAADNEYVALRMPEPMGEADLRKLVAAIYHARAFCSSHVPDPNKLPEYFIPMRFWTAADVLFAREHIAFIYEWLDKMIGLSPDGHPMFASFQTLNNKDSERLQKLFLTYKTWHKAWDMEPTHAGSDSGSPS